jgi:hypothetical protein
MNTENRFASPRLTFRRKILLGLLIIPIVIVIISLFQTTLDPGLELVYLVFGVPICVLNVWEWFEPEVAEKLFGKNR